MKLTRKLTLALITGILLVLAANAAFRVSREIALFERDSRRDSLLLGRTLAGSVARIWPSVGEKQALDLVEDANERESAVRIRWVWLDEMVVEPEGRGSRPILQPVASRDPGILQFTSGEGHERALYTYIPVDVSGPRRGAIEVRDTLVDQRRYVSRTVYQALTTTVVLVVLCGAIAMGLGVVLVARPVASLIDQARRIGLGDLSRRLDLKQRDEVGELAREMNTMCDLLERANETAASEAAERIEALEQLRHADRLSTVGQLAAGIAHELGTPLNVILGRAQLLLKEHPPSESSHKNAQIILEQAKRVTTIIRQLLDFARRRGPNKSPESLHHLAQQTLAMLGSLAEKSSVDLVLEGEEDVRADIDAGQLQQALTNLVVNGIQSMPRGGKLVVRTGRRPSEGEGAPGRVFVSVRDAGSGMTPAVRDRVFEPFFTTKGPGEGTGLGLSVTYGIVKEHGGTIEVESEPERGSCFTLSLPEAGR